MISHGPEDSERSAACYRRIRAFEIEREEARACILGRNVIGPAVSGGHGAVDRLVGVGEPARALVVEV